MKKICKNCNSKNGQKKENCYVCGKSLEDAIEENEENKVKFYKDKNIIISILVVILFWSIITRPNISNYENTINSLNEKIYNYEKNMQETQTKLDELQENNKSLEDKTKTFENEANDLKKKNEELKNENENLKKENENLSASTKNKTNNQAIPVAQSNPQAKNTYAQQNQNTQMVWIGKTGNKYHRQSCPTLKGNGSQVPLQSVAGREPCKVCKP